MSSSFSPLKMTLAHKFFSKEYLFRYLPKYHQYWIHFTSKAERKRNKGRKGKQNEVRGEGNRGGGTDGEEGGVRGRKNNVLPNSPTASSRYFLGIGISKALLAYPVPEHRKRKRDGREWKQKREKKKGSLYGLPRCSLLPSLHLPTTKITQRKHLNPSPIQETCTRGSHFSSVALAKF